MNITDGMIEDAARLLAREHGSDVFDVGHVPYEFTEAERSQYRAEAREVAEFVAPLIAAQALPEDQERTEWGVRWHGADVILGDEAKSRAVADRHANAVAVHRRAAGPWIEAGERSQDPDCCNAPNMVWEHSRAGKDHFRCHGCGGGMTKARATS